MTPKELSSIVKRTAEGVGFDHCRICVPGPIGRGDYLRRWLAGGMAGSMDYLHRNVESRLDPRELLPDAKSAIVVALLYKQAATPNETRVGRGRVAMYAWGEDYHDVIRNRLRSLELQLTSQVRQEFRSRICVDTAPIIERELAAAAGIGWIGKNTMAIHPELGSYFFLGVMLTTLALAADDPIEDHCGTCTACLEACPTQAFHGPYQMDASRCISYLTIEHRGDISKPFQEMMGDWLFGCDVCQDVCPHNRKAPESREPRFSARLPAPQPALDEIIQWNPEEYREKLRNSAMKRAKLDMLQRNARIALANQERQKSNATSASLDGSRNPSYPKECDSRECTP